MHSLARCISNRLQAPLTQMHEPKPMTMYVQHNHHPATCIKRKTPAALQQLPARTNHTAPSNPTGGRGAHLKSRRLGTGVANSCAHNPTAARLHV